jgi:hypothetical protein
MSQLQGAAEAAGISVGEVARNITTEAQESGGQYQGNGQQTGTTGQGVARE